MRKRRTRAGCAKTAARRRLPSPLRRGPTRCRRPRPAGRPPPRPPRQPRRRGPAVEPDLAYGAYQRGYFLTAFAEATRRVDEKGDPHAMTLLGELFSSGVGIPQNDTKAVEWYRLAAGRGDRDAMFALAYST